MDLETINDQSGFDFDSVEEAIGYWDAHKPDDAPDFSAEVLPYLRGVKAAETWPELCDRSAYTEGLTDRLDDVYRAIYPSAGVDARNAMFVDPDGHQPFDEHLSVVKGLCNLERVDDWQLEIFRMWCKLLPHLRLVPTEHDPNNAAFVWSRVRCFLAGAGYESHKNLANLLLKDYPLCGLDPDETKHEWHDALRAAHKACGWPAHLAWVQWEATVRAVGFEAPDTARPSDWGRAVAMLHALKHFRWSDVYNFVGVFNGASRSFTVAEQARSPKLLSKFLSGYRPPLSTKLISPLHVALDSIVEWLVPEYLLPKYERSQLPVFVLTGPWTRLVPTPPVLGFTQANVKLEHAWLAQRDKIHEYHGTEHEVLSFDWTQGGDVMGVTSATAFGDALPDSYTTGSPFDEFKKAFPNLDVSMYKDADAASVLFDLPIYASLLRAHIPELKNEFPIVMFQPTSPTFAMSTNQGKTLAAETYAKSMFPVDKATSVKDTSSAPDLRAIADQIRTLGSLVLDEWRQPKSKNHILSHDSMQSLCTGGNVTSGQAMENKNIPVTLRHSMVASCKAIDFPPDMVNRSLFWWLGELTDKMRNNGQNLADIRAGRVSLRMRLGAMAMIEKHGIADLLKGIAKVSSANGLRFEAHNTLALILYVIRTNATSDQQGSIDDAVNTMRSHLADHTAEATDSGVLDMIENSRMASLRLTSIFSDLTITELGEFVTAQDAARNLRADDGTFSTARETFKALQETFGVFGPFCRLLPRISNGRLDVSDKALVAALNDCILQTMENPGDTRPIPGLLGTGGWHMVRGADYGALPTFRLEHKKPDALLGEMSGMTLDLNGMTDMVQNS